MKQLLAVAAAVLVVAAGAGTAQAKTVLKLSAGPGAMLKYSTSTLKAKAGVVTIVMTNKGILPHDIRLRGNGVKAGGKIVGKGGISTFTVKLKKGKYTFYCSVPGHEQAGMKGTLVVK